MAQLLSNLPVGAKVKFGKYSVNGETAQSITWLVVAKNHSSIPAYPSNSITLLTEKIIDLRAIDAREPNNPTSARQTAGNNNYALSNIHQWLNSSAAPGEWFTASHAYDTAPTQDYVSNGGYYDSRPGFLYYFDTNERENILPTTVKCVIPVVDGGTYLTTPAQVFLPSITEIAGESENSIAEGTQWEYFNGASSLVAKLTAQAASYSIVSVSKTADAPWDWWLRSPWSSNNVMMRLIGNNGTYAAQGSAHSSNIGIRPALNISSTLKVSDTTDSDGCYTFIWNSAPYQPPALWIPTIYGGKSNTISWGISYDPDGDTLTYQLEVSIDGGDYTQIYSGVSNAYVHFVPFGTSTISYRVKATDPSGESSVYTTSTSVSVINNNAPVISDADANLGVKSEGFTGTYTVTDADSDIVTITEAIDGVQIRALVATLGEEITYGVTENTWLALPNGSHTLTIRATDGIDTSVRTYTFTKLVETLKIQNATPWVSSTMPTRIMLVITRNVPSAATFKVEVCNNGYDDSPTWEDATDAVMSGLVHVFTNSEKTAESWGVLVRVTVERNEATGACYVSAIGGNFE